MECMECFNEDAKKKKKDRTDNPVYVGRNDQITTSTKSLDIMQSLMDSTLI